MNNYASANQNLSSSPTFHIGVVGARGYSGLELSRLLLAHPQVASLKVYAHDPQFKLSDYLPESAALDVKTYDMESLFKHQHDTVFLATPAEASLKIAPELVDSGVDVIDLSGAFRLQGSSAQVDYKKWYGLEHTALDHLNQSHYGLVPWALPPAKKTSGGGRLIANPGCYATSILLAVLPLLKQGLVDAQTLVINAKSGTSGAGRKAAENLLFTEVDGECLPYRVGAHQHLPEICQITKAFTGVEVDPFFVTYLLNVRRGIISTLQMKLNDGISEADVKKSYDESYSGYPLARVSRVSADRPHLLSLKQVVGSPRIHIRYHVDGAKLTVFSLIDNLLKGAASQALENFNRLYDLPTNLALTEKEGLL